VWLGQLSEGVAVPGARPGDQSVVTTSSPLHPRVTSLAFLVDSQVSTSAEPRTGRKSRAQFLGVRIAYIFDSSKSIRSEDGMTIADKAVLVTGANRGIGQALVAEDPDQRRETGICRLRASR